MKKVISSLDKVKNVEIFKKLSLLYKDLRLSQEEMICNQIASYYDQYGVLPLKDDLLKVYSGLDSEEILDDPDDYLRSLESSLVEKVVRQDLLDLSGDSVISLKKLDKIRSRLGMKNLEKINSIEDYDGRSDYDKMTSQAQGMKFFIETLDSEIMGVSYGTLLTLFGFAGHCKTTTALSMTYKNVVELGYNIAYVSFEVPKKEIYFDLLSRHAYDLYPDMKITAKRIKKAILVPSERDLLFDEIEPSFKEKASNKIFLLDHSDLADSSGKITKDSFSLVMKRISDSCKGGLDAFIIDYLNMIQYSTATQDTSGVNAFVSFLNDYVIEFSERGLIGILLCQANREGWKRAVKRGGRYTIDALAEFNQLERASYQVVSLFLDEALRASGEIKMQLLKNRSGQLIEEPFTTYVNPDNFFVGDVSSYGDIYSEETLDEVLL